MSFRQLVLVCCWTDTTIRLWASRPYRAPFPEWSRVGSSATKIFSSKRSGFCRRYSHWNAIILRHKTVLMISYHISVRLLITSFSVTLIITLKTLCFWSYTGQTLLIGHVHEAWPILTIETQQYMCKIDVFNDT